MFGAGIDLDSSLVDLANEKYKNSSTSQMIDFRVVDIMDDSDESLSDYMSENNIQGITIPKIDQVHTWWNDINVHSTLNYMYINTVGKCTHVYT